MSTPTTLKVFDYRALRLLLGCVAFSLPILVSLLASDTTLQSISAAYHADESRDIFVGLLFVVSAFLWAYNGHDIVQARLSKVASIAAIFVALFPTSCANCDPNFDAVLHYTGATVLFFILTIFCFKYFRFDTKNKTGKARIRSGIYLGCGWTMISCIMAIAFFSLPFEELRNINSAYRITFWGESIALAAFGVAWFVAGKLRFLVVSKGEALTLFHK